MHSIRKVGRDSKDNELRGHHAHHSDAIHHHLHNKHLDLTQAHAILIPRALQDQRNIANNTSHIEIAITQSSSSSSSTQPAPLELVEHPKLRPVHRLCGHGSIECELN